MTASAPMAPTMSTGPTVRGRAPEARPMPRFPSRRAGHPAASRMARPKRAAARHFGVGGSGLSWPLGAGLGAWLACSSPLLAQSLTDGGAEVRPGAGLGGLPGGRLGGSAFDATGLFDSTPFGT